MFFVGIDVASRKHDCCILDASAKQLDAFTFANTASGFEMLQSRLLSFGSPKDARIGLEATGVYGENLTNFLRCKNFDVTTINPLIVKKRQCATTLRKTKTDKSDASFLAHLMTQADFQPDLPISYHNSELKSLSRARFHAVQQRSAMKTKAKGILTVLFPEFSSIFSDIFGASAMAVLMRCPSAKDIAGCQTKTLENILCKASRGCFGREKAEALRVAARHTIGTYSVAKSLELQMLLEQIELANKHIARFDEQIKRIMDESNTTITSIPGIGYTLGAMILGEIGDIRRFASPAKLLAFAGLEPSVYESGNYTASSGSMVKRGSPYLRYALLQAARCAGRYNPIFHAYLEKKLAEGKHFNVATSHLAKKLVRVLFAILKKNAVYSLDYTPIAA